MKKNYVLDTNILLDSPNAIFGFDDNTVILTGTTLQELDCKKTMVGEIGYNARETCRIIEKLREKGNLAEGVMLDNGGKLLITQDMTAQMPLSHSLEKPDNRIIATTIALNKSSIGKTILVTNDVSMRVNASVCGLSDHVESYRNDHISSEHVYTGRTTMDATDVFIDALYDKRLLSLEQIEILCNGYGSVEPYRELIENEFVLVKSPNKSALAIFRGGTLQLICTKGLHPYGITPRNVAQEFALYALLAPADEIPFVILRGPAGTAKTFLPLAAALDQTYDSHRYRKYDKILISRNNVMADADFGYLPGDLDEKMSPLLAPFYDNLESLLRGKEKDEDAGQIQMQIEDMFTSNVLNICPLAYIRGRSITHSYLIVDETQNASRSQIRDIITRAGEGTKIVICGDPDQIDAHTLDKWNNGLVFASEKMKGSPLCAQITFDSEESVRSPLAKEAIKRLVL